LHTATFAVVSPSGITCFGNFKYVGCEHAGVSLSDQEAMAVTGAMYNRAKELLYG